MAAQANQPVTASRTGVCIIRARVEPGASAPLRARILLTTDVSQGFEHSVTVVEERAVVEAVRAWLSELLAGAPTGEDHPNLRAGP